MDKEIEVLQLHRPTKPRCRHSGMGSNRDSWHLPVIPLCSLNSGVSLWLGAWHFLTGPQSEASENFRWTPPQGQGSHGDGSKNNSHLCITYIWNPRTLAECGRWWWVTVWIKPRGNQKGSSMQMPCCSLDPLKPWATVLVPPLASFMILAKLQSEPQSPQL